jgi:hypothetical protein
MEDRDEIYTTKNSAETAVFAAERRTSAMSVSIDINKSASTEKAASQPCPPLPDAACTQKRHSKQARIAQSSPYCASEK